MKKKILLTLVAMVAAVVIATACGCDTVLPGGTTTPDMAAAITSYYTLATTATTITQKTTITSGETEVSSKTVVYNINLASGVTGTISEKTLNPDINAAELYTTKESTFTMTTQQAVSAMPVSLPLTSAMFVNGECSLSNVGNVKTYAFKIKNESVSSLFNITPTEAAKIQDAAMQVKIVDEKLSETKIEYVDSTLGHKVLIVTAYNMSALAL